VRLLRWLFRRRRRRRRRQQLSARKKKRIGPNFYRVYLGSRPGSSSKMDPVGAIFGAGERLKVAFPVQIHY